MLRAIYSSLLASPVTSRTNSQAKHGCTWYSKEGSPPAFRVMLFYLGKEQASPPVKSKLSSQATEDLSRPGCRKRKCRCGCVSPCGLCDSANCFCLAQDAKFGDHFFAMFLHVPHTHRGNGWPLLLSVAILRVRSRVTEYGSALCGLCHDLVLCRQCRCDDGDDG
jgi:hypothetical protein